MTSQKENMMNTQELIDVTNLDLFLHDILKSKFIEVLQLFRENNHGFTIKDLRNLLDEVINEI